MALQATFSGRILPAPGILASHSLGTRPAYTGTSRRAWLRSIRPARVLQAVASKELQGLKADLLAAIEDVPEVQRNGPPSEAVMGVIKEIEEQSKSQPIKLGQGSPIDGIFATLANSSSHFAADGSVTLGTLSFQQFGPKDAKIFPESGIGSLRQGVDQPGEYNVTTGFRVAEGKGEGIVALSTVLGYYELSGEEHPNRQQTYFTGLQLEPADKSTEGLKAWLDFAKSENPTMDDEGVVRVEFPQKIPGHRDFLLLDEELQITIGNRGGYVAVKRKT